jgi:hypothetical protein
MIRTLSRLRTFQDRRGSGVTASSLLTGLRGYWKLGEASGTRADSHTNGLDLTAFGTPGNTTGIQGDAVLLSRPSNQYLLRANEANLQLGDIFSTIVFWFRLTTKEAGAMTIIAKDDTTGGGRGWNCYHAPGSDRIVSELFDGTNLICTATANSFGAPSTGVWNFGVLRHDPTANTWSIRINNGTADSFATTGPAGVGTGAFTIGRRPGETDYLNGAVDEVGIWAKSLSAPEEAQLWNGGAGTTIENWT